MSSLVFNILWNSFLLVSVYFVELVKIICNFSLIEMIDENIQQRRHTVLLSATLTKEVERLAGLSLHDPVKVEVASDSQTENTLDSTLIIPDSLSQYYIIVPPKLRLVTLASLLLDKCSVRTCKATRILILDG